MGDEGCEPMPFSKEKLASGVKGDEISDAIASDADLCDLVRFWSTLDRTTKDIIVGIVRDRAV